MFVMLPIKWNNCAVEDKLSVRKPVGPIEIISYLRVRAMDIAHGLLIAQFLAMTSILLIDHNEKDRTYYADRLKLSIPDCLVLEARDIQSGLDLYQSRRVDCIVTEIYLPDSSGFELLIDVVPRASEPTVAVIMLTRLSKSGLAQLAKTNGAHAFFVKRLTSGDELAHAIQQAIVTAVPPQKVSPADHGSWIDGTEVVSIKPWGGEHGPSNVQNLDGRYVRAARFVRYDSSRRGI